MKKMMGVLFHVKHSNTSYIIHLEFPHIKVASLNKGSFLLGKNVANLVFTVEFLNFSVIYQRRYHST